jgi:SAM-dependent methyltransferase
MRPTEPELDVVYNNYDYGSEPPNSTAIAKKRSIAKILHSYRKIEFVLDVGCGSGEWLDIFRESKCHTFGTEYNEKQKRTALGKGHKILDGGLLPVPEDNLKFDLVIFTEVIEHIQNPIETLSHLNSLLSENGLIYITTPNFSAIERHILKDNWGIICYPEHLTYYTPRTLNLALRKTNFSKIRIYTENISIFRIMQGFNKKTAGKDGLSPLNLSDKIQAAASQNVTLNFAKKLINFFLNFFGVGVSIVAVYKKQRNDHQFIQIK